MMELYYSISFNALCDNDGYPLQSIPELAYGDTPICVFSVLDSENKPIDLSSASKWELSVDVDRNVATSNLCNVSPTGFSYDANKKTLTFRLNSRTLEFLTAVDGKSQITLISELCGYDSNNTRIFRFAWNMIGLMPVGGGAVPETDYVTEDYTAFEVYANAEEIPAGTTHPELGYVTNKISAQMTEKFAIRTNYKHEDSDVVVDWGDGTTSSVNKGEIESEDLKEWDREHQYEAKYFMSHTYTAEGKYVIKVYGKKYFAVSNQWTQDNNLICRCLDKDLPLASCVNNLAGFATKAKRLIEICIPTSMNLWDIENFYILFENCVNLLYAYGLKRKLKITRSTTGMFSGCSSLKKTDFVLPVSPINTESGLNLIFKGCSSLTTPIQNIIPSAGFACRVIKVENIFYGCTSLTGTVPAKLLWEDTSKVWQGTSSAFQGASEAIRSQVPTSWGGTNADINIPK